MGTIVTEHFLKWQKAEARNAVVITGATFQEVLALQAKDVFGGTYKVHWYMEASRTGGTNFDRSVRVRLGGVIIGEHNWVQDSSSVFAYAGWDIQEFGNRATPLLDVQVKTVGGTPPRNINVRNVRLSIELMEIDPGPRGLGNGQPGQGGGRN